ncbi:hypothetical protein M8C21_015178 [Ambrosia artemisiifolia]|uniref:Uncharacterized protein n=1 Tax=Ambrosia artemisiifolia TaxID=4212 RepID=A0AAD5BKZ7_AMBAR|nr:hypothetical protein M8C21_015178 [Ambrosia artemisiifolia]
MLQCRTGKCAGKSAVEMVSEGLIDIRMAIKRVEPQHPDQFLHPQKKRMIPGLSSTTELFGVVGQAQTKADENANLMNENEQLKSLLEEQRVDLIASPSSPTPSRHHHLSFMAFCFCIL